MKTYHCVLKLVISIISSFVGGYIGSGVGRIGGLILGIMSGFIVGYFYAHYTLRIKSPSHLVRIIFGTGYGIIAGLISGASVHIPKIMTEPGFMILGAIFGIFVGSILGLILSVILAFIPREISSE